MAAAINRELNMSMRLWRLVIILSQSNQAYLSFYVKKTINYLRKAPKPIRFNIFFSKVQKN